MSVMMVGLKSHFSAAVTFAGSNVTILHKSLECAKMFCMVLFVL